MGQVSKIVEPLLRGFTDAAVVVNREGRIVFHNPPFAAMTGLSRRALAQRLSAGTDVFTLLGAPTQVDREAIARCFESNRVFRLAEIAVESADAQQYIVWLSVSPVTDEQGGVVAAIAQYRDVSAEARMQTRFRELLALSHARAEDLERLVEVRTRELHAAFEEVQRLSRTDPLTGLLNRRAFGEAAIAGLTAAERHQRSAALLMCDLDNFKRVNDQHGHGIGDLVLTTCAQVLRRSFRSIDSEGRFGGEEFVAFLSDTTLEGALEAARRFRVALEATPIQDGETVLPLVQTVSIGVAVYPQHGSNLDELVGAADRALYAAKRMGRNRVVLAGTQGPTVEAGVPIRTPTPTPPDGRGLRPRRPTPAEALPRALAVERVLIVESDPGRQQRYREVLLDGFEVTQVGGLAEALELCRRDQYGICVADMEQGDDSGLFVLGELMRQQPGAVRVLIVESQQPFEQLLGTNLAMLDYVLLRRDLHHLPSAIESCRARRDSYRTHPLARGPQPSRWLAQAQEMARIVSEKRFSVAYQPIVHAADSSLFAHEVLCRVAPGSTVGLVDLFDWALREGEIWNLGREIRHKAAHRLDERPDALLFFNLHPAELLDPELTNRETELDRHAQRVVFEITERAAIGDFTRMRTAMRRLRQRGFRFAIDDLGAGYAGLNSVAMLSPDFIKVDMTIIRDIDRMPIKARLLRRMVEFADEEGVKIVAEGVETEAERARVCEVGCHLIQGFLIGMPLEEGPEAVLAPVPALAEDDATKKG
ncbi:MAG: diguanylate cyclase [Proteobacteria bacterium]|nr:diguanylate cyclase [Pseudomonadota bacterium]